MICEYRKNLKKEQTTKDAHKRKFVSLPEGTFNWCENICAVPASEKGG